MRTERNKGEVRQSKQRARDLFAIAVGCIAFAAAGMTPCSAQRPTGAAVSGTEEIEATPSLIREIQFMLLRVGIDPGPIDGVVGPQTTGAFRKFQERAGLPIRDLVNGGRVSESVLAKLRGDAARVMFESDKPRESPPAPAKLPAAAVPAEPPPAEKPDRFAACPFNPDDFRIGTTQYTPDKYLQIGFEGSTARAVSMLKDRLNEARQIAGSIGGAALNEVQRQSRVLDYFGCRLKIEQGSNK